MDRAWLQTCQWRAEGHTEAWKRDSGKVVAHHAAEDTHFTDRWLRLHACMHAEGTAGRAINSLACAM